MEGGLPSEGGGGGASSLATFQAIAAVSRNGTRWFVSQSMPAPNGSISMRGGGVWRFPVAGSTLPGFHQRQAMALH